jgi:hypothetical protein
LRNALHGASLPLLAAHGEVHELIWLEEVVVGLVTGFDTDPADG